MIDPHYLEDPDDVKVLVEVSTEYTIMEYLNFKNDPSPFLIFISP